MSASRISFGRRYFGKVRAIAFFAGIVACSRGGGGGAPSGEVADVASSPSAPSARSTAIDATTSAVDAAIDTRAGSAAAAFDPAYATAKPISGKSVGHTSVVFKLKLDGGLEAAYKPQSKRGHSRYRGEVAAYRLARALGIDNVPPAIARTFRMDALRAAVGGEPIFADVVPNADGSVSGALIPWIKGLDFLPLERDPWMSRWKGWLAKGGAIPSDDRAFASQISTMIVFDYVTGNWDRWSGGNVGTDPSKTTILYIDNDGAFFDPPPAPALARQLAFLEGVDRFSRAFVDALRAVDLKAAMGDETPGAPLLSAHVLTQVDERRKKALAIIDAKMKALGEAEVLIF
jgi:hypothetical protein